MYGGTYVSTSVSQYAALSAPCPVWRPPSSAVPSTPCWNGAPHLLRYGDPCRLSGARSPPPEGFLVGFLEGFLAVSLGGGKEERAARRIGETGSMSSTGIRHSP